MIELGILADDLTGGMMVASLLEREGISCPLVSSIDELESITDSDAQAVVVARKIRLIAPDDARLEAVSTVKALQSIGCKRF
ncbi:MAG: four-carbon acid sugar kinase family protein, partial [Pseudomonadota bacterium]|nr:four-carbon acid sugar kinase family protein [Pseudomonadota bacterium]